MHALNKDNSNIDRSMWELSMLSMDSMVASCTSLSKLRDLLSSQQGGQTHQSKSHWARQLLPQFSTSETQQCNSRVLSTQVGCPRPIIGQHSLNLQGGCVVYYSLQGHTGLIIHMRLHSSIQNRILSLSIYSWYYTSNTQQLITPYNNGEYDIAVLTLTSVR